MRCFLGWAPWRADDHGKRDSRQAPLVAMCLRVTGEQRVERDKGEMRRLMSQALMTRTGHDGGVKGRTDVEIVFATRNQDNVGILPPRRTTAWRLSN